MSRRDHSRASSARQSSSAAATCLAPNLGAAELADMSLPLGEASDAADPDNDHDHDDTTSLRSLPQPPASAARSTT